MAASWEAGLSPAVALRRATTAAKAGTLETSDARKALKSASRILRTRDTDSTCISASLGFLLACSKAARSVDGSESALGQLSPDIAACLPGVILCASAESTKDAAIAIFISYSRAVQSLTGVLGILSKFGFCSGEVRKNGSFAHVTSVSSEGDTGLLSSSMRKELQFVCRKMLCWALYIAPGNCLKQLICPSLHCHWTARRWWQASPRACNTTMMKLP